MSNILIKQATIVNEYKKYIGDVYIRKGYIERIDTNIDIPHRVEEIDASQKILIPGIIDDQVHFREPGNTHKACIESESKAALLGGVTSYMEMPNTNPATFTKMLLEEKYAIASRNSYANYSFYLGASHDNLEEIKKLDIINNCGVKIFMGSSTGNLLVEEMDILNAIFQYSPTLIATHCEEEHIIKHNIEKYKELANTTHNPALHPEIRNREACIVSSQKAIALANKHNSRLHILHISTSDEVALFDASIPLINKKITSEACVHHLWYSERDYERLGNKIVCNPAIKTENDRIAIFQGVLKGNIDIIATDHAPHTKEEKSGLYPNIPSGVPLVQHALLMMMQFVHNNQISIEQLVDKMCHAPAICFKLRDRGYIREGYKADLVLINSNTKTTISEQNIAYQCAWSPLEGYTFDSSIEMTILNGVIAQKQGKIIHEPVAQRLQFH